MNVLTLANYLAQKANTDLEKSRAIYVWIAKNVKYHGIVTYTVEKAKQEIS